MCVISVINYKGGIGKTTVTANIAAELACRGKKVLMLDLDPQANLTFSFINEDEWQTYNHAKRTIKSWYDAFIYYGETIDLAGLIVTPEKVNDLVKGSLNLICSHLGLINVDLEYAGKFRGATEKQQKVSYLKVYSLLARGLKRLLDKEKYDVVLIDCPPNFNVVTKTALIASDYYIIPAKPDFLSTLGIEELRKHVKEMVNVYHDYAPYAEYFYKIDPKFLGIIFNMVSLKDEKLISTQNQYLEGFKERGMPIFDTYIRENKSIYGDAPEYGIPIVINSKNAGGIYEKVRHELEDLTAEFIKKAGL